MTRLSRYLTTYIVISAALALVINVLALHWFDGPLLYFPFVLMSFILFNRFGIKIALAYLSFFAFFTAYFYIPSYRSFVIEEASDVYVLLALWFLATLSFLFLEWTKENFSDHH